MLKSKMNPRVFWGASAIAGALLLVALVAPGASDLFFGRAQAWVIDTFGWFYVASVAGFLAVAAYLALGPTGRDFLYRLGARSRPLPAITPLDAPEGRRAIEWRMTAQTGEGTRPRDVTGFTRQQIVADVLDHLQAWRLA